VGGHPVVICFITQSIIVRYQCWNNFQISLIIYQMLRLARNAFGVYSKDSQCQVARVSSHEGSLRWWSGRTTPFVLQDLGRCYNFCNMLRMQFQVLILWFCNRETVKFEIVSLLGQVNVLAVEYPGYGICPGGQAKILEWLRLSTHLNKPFRTF